MSGASSPSCPCPLSRLALLQLLGTLEFIQQIDACVCSVVQFRPGKQGEVVGSIFEKEKKAGVIDVELHQSIDDDQQRGK